MNLYRVTVEIELMVMAKTESEASDIAILNIEDEPPSIVTARQLHSEQELRAEERGTLVYHKAQNEHDVETEDVLNGKALSILKG
jgi:hypothetical protein